MNDINFAFFGTPKFAVSILEELKIRNLLPSLIVTTLDKPKGRKLALTPPPVKIFALENNIEIYQPDQLNTEEKDFFKKREFDLFVVAAYGKIIPRSILDLPKYGALNVHPSLLPKYRGASPVESQILNDEKNIGVSIMILDEKMDHGPIVAKKEIKTDEWPIEAGKLEKILAHSGGELLSEVIPSWVKGKIEAKKQDHQKATFTKKIKKEDALIDLSGDPYQNLLKIKAYDVWPRAYFLARKNGKNIRVAITEAHVQNGDLIIDKVVPEGKKEMNYQDFLRGLKYSSSGQAPR